MKLNLPKLHADEFKDKRYKKQHRKIAKTNNG